MRGERRGIGRSVEASEHTFVSSVHRLTWVQLVASQIMTRVTPEATGHHNGSNNDENV